MSTTTPHWLVIVDQARPDLTLRLRQSFGHDSPVHVFVDRRRGERRRGSAQVGADRRRADRRQAPSARGSSPHALYRLIQQGDGFLAFQALGRRTARCPECRQDLDFEMPRFAEPPARLTLDVVHTPQRSGLPQHHIEAEAFKPTGRSLLACRILARRSPPMASLEPFVATPALAHA